MKQEFVQANTKLDAANKRADGVEKRRAALQEENDELVRQLEEVRGRVVEVMEEKMVLAASVESWETKSRAWDKQRQDLESPTEDVKVGHTAVVDRRLRAYADWSSLSEIKCPA